MKIVFAFARDKRSEYGDLLDDYLERIGHFAKVETAEYRRRQSAASGGAASGENSFALHIRFVVGSFGYSDGGAVAGAGGGFRSASLERRLTSEDLAERIRACGAANIKVSLANPASLRVRDGAGSVAFEGRDARTSRDPFDGARPPESRGGLPTRDASEICDVILVDSPVSGALAQVMAAEQIYRAFMILHRRKYHK